MMVKVTNEWDTQKATEKARATKAKARDNDDKKGDDDEMGPECPCCGRMRYIDQGHEMPGNQASRCSVIEHQLAMTCV